MLLASAELDVDLGPLRVMERILSSVILDNVSNSASNEGKSRLNQERRTRAGLERRARTRKLVLQATFSLLGTAHGMRTQIDQVTREAGISRATFYNHFSSMEHLLDVLQVEMNHSFNTAVLAVITPMPPPERVDAAVRYYLTRARQDSKWAWAMVHISAGGVIFGAETYESCIETMHRGIASGVFGLTDGSVGRDLNLGTCLAAMITQLRSSPGEDFAQTVSRTILRGLGVKAARIESIVTRTLPDPFFKPTAHGTAGPQKGG